MTLWVYPPEKKLRKELTFHQGIFYIFTDFYIFYQPLREEYKLSVIVNWPVCFFCSICSSCLLRLCWQVLTYVGLLYLGEITFIICVIFWYHSGSFFWCLLCYAAFLWLVFALVYHFSIKILSSSLVFSSFWCILL